MEEHRDADTWAIHLLYARDQGFNPDYTVADQCTGLRAGQKIVWEDKPCHGDVFHILQQCESLANVLASGATSRRQVPIPAIVTGCAACKSCAAQIVGRALRTAPNGGRYCPAGMYAYSRILSALLLRAKTGRGSHIDVSMLEALAEWMS